MSARISENPSFIPCPVIFLREWTVKEVVQRFPFQDPGRSGFVPFQKQGRPFWGIEMPENARPHGLPLLQIHPHGPAGQGAGRVIAGMGQAQKDFPAVRFRHRPAAGFVPDRIPAIAVLLQGVSSQKTGGQRRRSGRRLSAKIRFPLPDVVQPSVDAPCQNWIVQRPDVGQIQPDPARIPAHSTAVR